MTERFKALQVGKVSQRVKQRQQFVRRTDAENIFRELCSDVRESVNVNDRDEKQPKNNFSPLFKSFKKSAADRIFLRILLHITVRIPEQPK